MRMTNFQNVVVQVSLLLLRLCGGVVGFAGCLLGLRHSHFGLLVISLILTAAAGVSLKDSLPPVGERWRIPIVFVLTIVVILMLGSSQGIA